MAKLLKEDKSMAKLVKLDNEKQKPEVVDEKDGTKTLVVPDPKNGEVSSSGHIAGAVRKQKIRSSASKKTPLVENGCDSSAQNKPDNSQSAAEDDFFDTVLP